MCAPRTNDNILLNKLYNTQSPETEWIALNFQQILTTRQTKFLVIKTNNKRIGNNIVINRLHVLNNKINLSDLNESLSSFKVKQKSVLFPKQYKSF